MAKRKGVNSRKRYAQRKKKVGGSIKKIGPKLLLAGVIGGILFGVIRSNVLSVDKVVATVKDSGVFTVRSIAVKGNAMIAESEILEQCNISGSIGLFTINSPVINAKLMSNPWVEQARCVKRLWGKVIIEIVERVPVAMLNAGEIVLVDRKGVILPIEPETEYDLPLIHGISVKKGADGRQYVDSVQIARLCTFVEGIRTNDPDLYQIMSQFDMSSEHCVRGYAVTPRTVVTMDYLIDGVQLENLHYMLQALALRKDVPESVNVQYQNLAFVTMKQNSSGEHVN